MKTLITTALATLVAAYGYSQDGIHLPLTGGTLSGNLTAGGTGAATVLAIDNTHTNAWGGNLAIRAGGINKGYFGTLGSLVGSTNHDMTVWSVLGGGFRVFTDGYNLRYTIDASGNNTWTGSGTFGGDIHVNSKLIQTTSSNPTLGSQGYHSSAGHYIYPKAGSDFDLFFYNSLGQDVLMVPTGTRNVQFPGALTGTSATLNGTLSVSAQANFTNNIYVNGDNEAGHVLQLGGTNKWQAYANASYYSLYNYTLSNTAFYINNGTNAANFAGALNVGTAQSNANLYVHGIIKSKEVKVEATVAVPDYVFEESYELKSLSEVEKYIIENKHLPEIPSAKTIEKNGINVGDMQLGLLKKIEELTLYMIDFKKEMEVIKSENQTLKTKVAQLESIE